MKARAEETRVMAVYIEWCRYSAALSAIDKTEAAEMTIDSVQHR